MAHWFPMTGQYIQPPPQGHLEAPVYAQPPAAPLHTQPHYSTQVPCVYGFMPMPMPMQYSSVSEMWMPISYHAAQYAARQLPLSLQQHGTSAQQVSQQVRLHHQSAALQGQWRDNHAQVPSLSAATSVDFMTNQQPHSHVLPGTSGPYQIPCAPGVQSQHTSIQMHRPRRKLDHLARSWSPTSAAASSITSNPTHAALEARSQSSHSQADTHDADALHGTMQQLNSLQLRDRDGQGDHSAASTSHAGLTEQSDSDGWLDGTAQQSGKEHHSGGSVHNGVEGEQPGGQSNAGGSCWQGLTEGLLKDITGLLPDHCNKRCRLVCRRWQQALDANLQELTPKHAQVHMFSNLFPAITKLDLSGCQNVRNRNLAILSKSGLAIRRLTIGHTSLISYGKPRITNQALQSISEFTGLQKLVLADCSAVTTGGLDQLRGLTGLTHLALLRLARVGHVSLHLLQSLTCLTYLAFTSCSKAKEGWLEQSGVDMQVSDSSMQSVAGLPSLRQLALGHTKVGDPGLALLAALPHLTHLHLQAEAITLAGLQALSGLTGLKSLGLSQCGGLLAEQVLAATCHHTGLTRLILHDIQLSTDHICALAKDMPQLQVVGMQGSHVNSAALAALAGMAPLRSLSLTLTGLSSSSLLGISCLTQLTSLQVQGCAATPCFLQSLGQMHSLQALDLHHLEARGPLGGAAPALNDALVKSLARCRSLAWLDISQWGLAVDEVSRLIMQLSALQQICVLRCFAYRPEHSIAILEAKHPQVHFVNSSAGSLWESITV